MSKQRQRLAEAAADGDRLAAAALRDLAIEEGEDPVLEPVVGQWYYIYTAAHAYVGRLAAQDHEAYLLAPPVTWVIDTGQLNKFFSEGKAAYCETVHVAHRVRRGGVLLVADWPTGRPPVAVES